MLGNFACAVFFSKLTFSKEYLRFSIRMSNSLDLDQDGHSVGPNLGPNLSPDGLQWLSADAKGSNQQGKSFNVFLTNGIFLTAHCFLFCLA